jgi:hypothetical protein
MSNRKKVAKKGFRPTHSVIDEIDRIQKIFSGKYNAYTCATCEKAFLTLDVDEGATPTFMRCLATEGCKGSAMSAGYPEGDPPEYMGDAIVHWVKPSAEELGRLSPGMVTHVKEDGLIAKPTEAAPDWVKTLLNATTTKEN